MTPITSAVTPEQVQEATLALRALLQEQDPNLDLSIGGAVDSILVNGNAAIVARNDQEVNRVYLAGQLKAIAEGTVTITDEDLDTLMAGYFLVRRQSIPAYGIGTFVVQTNQQYVFQAGYRVVGRDQGFITTTTYTIYPVGTVGVDFTEPTNILIREQFDPVTGYQFRFDLPITAEQPGPQAILVSGDLIVPDVGFVGLGRVFAASTFKGGTLAETNQQFAQRGLSGLVVKSAGGGPASLDTLIDQAVPLADGNPVGTGDPLMGRDRANLFNLPTGGKVDLYCRSGAIASTSFIVDATVTNFTTRTAQITLTREQSAAVYRVGVAGHYTSAPNPLETGGITIVSVANNPWVTTGFNPVMPNQIDRAFSTRQQIVITFQDQRVVGVTPVVSMTANGQVLVGQYVVSTSFQDGCLTVDNALCSDPTRPPGLDLLIKGAVPCQVSLGVTAVRPVNYVGPDGTELAATLSQYINSLPVGTERLDQYTISNLVQQAAPQLVVTAVSMVGTVWCQDGTDLSVVPGVTGLVVPLDPVRKIGPQASYFTTTPNDVVVTLV